MGPVQVPGDLRRFQPIVLPASRAGPLAALGCRVLGACGICLRAPESSSLQCVGRGSAWRPWALVPATGAEGRRQDAPAGSCLAAVRGSRFSPTDLVTDLDFSPFDDFLLATASADRTVSGATGRAAPGPSTPIWSLLCSCWFPVQPPPPLSSLPQAGSRALALSRGRALCSAALLPEHGRVGWWWPGGDGTEGPGFPNSLRP